MLGFGRRRRGLRVGFVGDFLRRRLLRRRIDLAFEVALRRSLGLEIERRRDDAGGDAGRRSADGAEADRCDLGEGRRPGPTGACHLVCGEVTTTPAEAGGKACEGVMRSLG
jgi:hypothetical protein